MTTERNGDGEGAGEPPGEPAQPVPAADVAPPRSAGVLPSDDAPLRGLFRALRIFLVPFLLSWAFAYVGSARGAEWLYFAGLGGVTLSLVGLMIWLIS
jgi:hypothetical protein